MTDRKFTFEGVPGVYFQKAGLPAKVGDCLRLPNGSTFQIVSLVPVFEAVDIAFERPMSFGVRIIDLIEEEK